MDQLAHVLMQNTPLSKLDLSFNRISDEGIIKIANAIEVLNTNLEWFVSIALTISINGYCYYYYYYWCYYCYWYCCFYY